MIFKIKADAEFEARNLDDAFFKLALHFWKLMIGKDSSLFIGGEIHINKLEDKSA